MGIRRINLVPQEAMGSRLNALKWRLKRGDRKVWAGLIGLVLVVFMTGWQLSAVGRYRMGIAKQEKLIRKFKTKTTQQEALFAQVREQREAVTRERREIEVRLDVLQKADREKKAWSKVLVQLSQQVPQEVSLAEGILSAEGILLTGEATDNWHISQFMQQLDAADHFHNTRFVYTKSETKEESPTVVFKMITQHAE